MTREHPLSVEELMEFLDGELPAAQAAVVQAHVTGCESCRRLGAELRGISRDLNRWEVEDAPDTLSVPVMPQSKTWRLPILTWLRERPSLTAVMTVGLLLAVGLKGALDNVQHPRIVAFMAPDREAQSQTVPPSPFRSSGGAGVSAGRLSDPSPVAQVPPTSSLHVGQASRRPAQPASAAPVEAGAPAAVPAGPAIARTARLQLTTLDFDKTRAGVERMVSDRGGWFGQLDITGNLGQGRSLKATAMMPSAKLDDLVSAIRPLGVVVDESKQAEDVSEQIVDVQARLSNARNTERRLVDLLRSRTGKLTDVLEAEREVARVREEIERLDAQRQHFARRVTYATLELVVSEELPPRVDLGPRPVSAQLTDAFVAGLTQGLAGLLGVILFIVGFVPVLLVWSAVLAWPVFALWRRTHRSARFSPSSQDPKQG